MSNKLKPCPFCGGEAYYELDPHYSDRHVLTCEDCNCNRRFENSKEGVIRLWNDRYVPKEEKEKEKVISNKEITTKGNPHFYVICKKCGSDEMHFEGDGKMDEDCGLQIFLVCDSCGELNGIDEYLR